MGEENDVPTIVANATKKLNLVWMFHDFHRNFLHVHLHDTYANQSDLVDVLAVVDARRNFLALGFADERAYKKFGQDALGELFRLTAVQIYMHVNADFLDDVLRFKTFWLNYRKGIYILGDSNDRDKFF